MSPPTAYISWRTLLYQEGREDRIERNKNKVFYYLHEDEAIRILAFVGGYVDAAGYVKFDGLFTSSVTGNLVAACASVYHTRRVLSRSVVCITFGVGAFLAVAIAIKLRLVSEWKKRSVGSLLYFLEFIVLLVTMITGLIYDDIIAEDTENWRLLLVSGLMGLSMGIHNAAGKDTIANCPSTTVMTMTIVQVASNAATTFMYRLAIDTLTTLYPTKAKPVDYDKKINALYIESIPKLATAVRPLILFIIGALIGTVVTSSAASYWGLCIPMALCLGLVWDILVGRYYDEHPKPEQFKAVPTSEPPTEDNSKITVELTDLVQKEVVPVVQGPERL